MLSTVASPPSAFAAERGSGSNLARLSPARVARKPCQLKMVEDARDRDVGAVGGGLRWSGLSQNRIEGLAPATGVQVLLAEERASHVARHLAHEDVVLREPAA